MVRRPQKYKTLRRNGKDGDSVTVISSAQLANLYTTIDTLRKANKMQKLRGDAQEKALRILWEEVRKIKERRGGHE